MKYKLINYYPPYEKKDIRKIVWFDPNNLLGPENYPEFWEEVVEKDYKILSLARFCSIKPSITDVSVYGDEYIEALLKCDKSRIHSIKRLSDDKIFTIGDKVFGEYVNYTINKIKIVNNKCMITALYNTNNPNGSRLHYNLNNLKKCKQPLFTTEDGIDVYEGENVWFLPGLSGNPYEKFATCKNESLLTFSTKEKAEEYVLMNKPCLSLNDIFKNVEEMREGLKTFEDSQLAERFKKLVKQKLKSC